MLSVSGDKTMKKAIIEVLLIEEAVKKTNKKLEKEIMDELSEELPKIPWQGKIVKVTVLDN